MYNTKYNKNYYKKIKKLTRDKSFYTLAITCFSEHLPGGEAKLNDRIRGISSDEFQIISIKHNKSSKNKPHIHILIRIPDGKRRKKVNPMLKKLGVVFRDGIDDKFLKKTRALETCGSFAGYTLYLLHQTPEAKQEGKARYEKEDITTNLSIEELQLVLDGYSPSKKQLSKTAIPHIIDEMREAGYNLASYKHTLESYEILGMTKKQENSFKEAYISGLKERYITNYDLTRITLEIEYPENASNEQIGLIDSALREAMSGYRCSYATDLPIHIDPFTEVVILFNVPYSDKEQRSRYMTDKFYIFAREMSVNKIIEISKPKCLPKSLWAGRYLIVTHTFNDHSELNPHTNSLVYRYIPNGIFCTIQNNHLVFTEMPQIVLTEEESKQITKELKQIRDKFNDSIKNIKPKSSTLTLDDLNS